MQLTLSAGGVCLLWVALLLGTASADSPSQFDYRRHHEGAAAIANGHNGKHGEIHEAPRVRERFAREQYEPERWAQYVPHSSKSIAEEMIEARRHAREEETKRIQTDRQEQEQKVKQEAQEADQAKVEANKRKGKGKGQSAIKKAAQSVKSATKRTSKKAQAKAEHWLELDDDEEEDEEDEEGSSYRRSRRRNASSGIAGRVYGAFKWVLAVCYMSLAWSGRNLLWIPSKYAVQGIRWSAHTSWRTTRWTGERAFIGPALTVGAPVIYLGEGFLFLFVWTPARIASFIARELYPIYIFLGAALAVGTAMGIGSALILYVGSFFLSDSSTVEWKFARQGEALPSEMEKRIKVKASAARKWAKSGESVIQRAMQESLDKAKQGAPESEESDEDDDYFGPDDTTTTIKGKGRSTSDQTSNASTRRTPNHFGPPLPVGATGWNHSRSESASNTSSPTTSPTSARNPASSGSSPVYSSGKSKLSASPLTSPDVFRSRSSRQRRGVSSSSSSLTP